MDNEIFIVSYDGNPLVVITNHKHVDPLSLLKWYAKEYAFELIRLNWSVVDHVEYKSKEKENL